ncbi:class I SAM-dependent methyltransferase, partial [Klebsiella pneumoniae]
AHHCPRPEQAFTEVHRVLKPRGSFILVDNTAPADADSEQVLNKVERLRDPSHQRVWSVPGWTRLLKTAGFTSIRHLRSWETPVQWKEWMDRAQTPEPPRRKALRLLLHSSESMQQALGFTPSEDDPILVLRKSMWICHK